MTDQVFKVVWENEHDFDFEQFKEIVEEELDNDLTGELYRRSNFQQEKVGRIRLTEENEIQLDFYEKGEFVSVVTGISLKTAHQMLMDQSLHIKGRNHIREFCKYSIIFLLLLGIQLGSLDFILMLSLPVFIIGNLIFTIGVFLSTYLIAPVYKRDMPHMKWLFRMVNGLSASITAAFVLPWITKNFFIILNWVISSTLSG